MMSRRSEDVALSSNKFVGKRIENTLSFNVAGMTPHSEFDSQKSAAVPVAFQVPGKKGKAEVPANNVSEKQRLKGKQISNGDDRTVNNQKQLAFQNLKNTQMKNLNQFQRDNDYDDNEEEEDVEEEGQYGDYNSYYIQKDGPGYSAIPGSEYDDSNEGFASKKMKSKSSLNQMTASSVSVEQSGHSTTIEQSQFGDIDEMVRKSNLKYKNDKDMMKRQQLQKQFENQRLKEQLKKQEEEIRKRNLQKTQMFKEKKKREQKELAELQAQQKREQENQKNSQRQKSLSRLHNSSVMSQSQHQQQYTQNSSREHADATGTAAVSKEEFDAATKNRVKELMRKQREEKEKAEEEKYKKRLKLEQLRQEQLVQLSKAKIKTKEQEEEERKSNVVKRAGGAGPSSIIQQQQQQSQRGVNRVGSYQKDLSKSSAVASSSTSVFSPDYEDNFDYGESQLYSQQQSMSQQQLQYKSYQQQVQQQQYQQPDIPQKSKRQAQPKQPQQRQPPPAVAKKNSSAVTVKQDKFADMKVSEEFLKEHIQKSIRQLYPTCSAEDMAELELEFRMEFEKEEKNAAKYRQKSAPKSQRSRSSQRISHIPVASPAVSSTKNKGMSGSFVGGNNQQSQKKPRAILETQNELKRLASLQKLENIDVDSVKDPAQMIFDLKSLADQLQGELETSDRKFGMSKQKQGEKEAQERYSQRDSIGGGGAAAGSEKLRREMEALEKQTYLKELYLNAQNYFSPDEMEDFQIYLQNHMKEGEIVLTSGDEDQGDDYEEDEDANNRNGKSFQRNTSNHRNFQQQQSQQLQQKGGQLQQDKNSLKGKPTKVNSAHPKSGRSTSLKSIPSLDQRGRSIDAKTPKKSCLQKEAAPAKIKRSKTVTFDAEFAAAAAAAAAGAAAENQTSLESSSQHLQRRKYEAADDNSEFMMYEGHLDGFEKIYQDKENSSGRSNLNSKFSFQFENPQQNNGQAQSKQKGQIGGSIGITHSSELGTPQTSLLGSRNNNNNNNGSSGVANQRRSQPKQQQQQIMPQPNSLNVSKKSTSNSASKDKMNKQGGVKSDSISGREQSTKNMIASKQPNGQQQQESMNEFNLGQEEIDFAAMEAAMRDEDIRGLVHVHNLDLKSFFKNEKLNSLQDRGTTELGDFGSTQEIDQRDDYSDEGLFADDSHDLEYSGNQQDAMNYYERNKGQLQSSSKKDTNNQQFNRNRNDDDEGENVQQPKRLVSNNYLSNNSGVQQQQKRSEKYGADDNLNEYYEDDALFALSATELLQLASAKRNQALI